MRFWKNQLFLLAFFFVAFAFFSSCKEDPPMPDDPKSEYDDGIFIINEGQFGTGTGTISFLSRDFNVMENEVFQNKNANTVLGNIAQSMTVQDDQAYIMVNNANKIEVVNVNDFSSVTTIEGIDLPRFMVAKGSIGYVSYWGDGFAGGVAVINLENNSIANTIPTGAGAEGMVIVDDKLYVANAGGFGNDSTVVVINLATEEIEKTLVVGDNPISLTADKDGNIWAFGRGYSDWNDPTLNRMGKLTKIVNDEVTLSLDIQNGFGNKMAINENQDMLYLNTDTHIFTHQISETTFSNNVFSDRGYYGIGVDPETGNIFCADAKDFSSRGDVTIFDAQGNTLKTFEVGVSPNGFVFR